MKAVGASVDFSAMERDVLAGWKKDGVFAAQNEKRKGSREFAFYDGPPFANGLPHYGHLLTNTIKDTVPRYWIMRGHSVDRRFGWDCHGVPVEFEIEKREKIKGRVDIMKLGVGKFNKFCSESVQHYTKEWEKTITRLGRWVDWDNQYRTMDRNFMESVWWVFSELFNKGLVYQSYKIVPYSPRITTVLSNFEANQNYKEVQDPAVTVKFKLKDEDASLLAWTTTPWTLVSNLALAVGPEIIYVKIKDTETNEIYYLAEARLDSVYKKKTYEILSRVKGSDLHGRKYEPLFPYFASTPNAFQIFADDYVETNEGTGVVHNAPAFGEDDFRVCKEHNVPLVDPLDDEGNFTAKAPDFSGMYFKDADKAVIKTLKDQHKILRHDVLVHSYPFCERTDQPLIYRAIPAWYVAVESFRDRLVANNKKINWVPEHLRDGRMGQWLENARDWAISRNRYWGTPLPIWICDQDKAHIDVFGSTKKLEEKIAQAVPDLHKPMIDELTYACSKCSGKMKRIPEVFDCWFESGSMPYAQLHFPFENAKRFDEIFPADFIAEGLDQTRGWFYTLSVLSTVLFDKPAFKNVVVNGTICDETGRKMSKRHRNYTAPDEAMEKFGADSMRLYMLNSAILRGEDLIFTDQGVRDTTRAVLLPLWNSHSFLTTYADADGWKPEAALASGTPPKPKNELDRWVISRLQTLMGSVHEQMEGYHLYAVVSPILGFIDDLTNWYIRRSRRRFWGQAPDDDDGGTANLAVEKKKGPIDPDTADAYATLYYVIVTFSKLFAPFAPYVSDKIYQNLTEGLPGLPKSVHLCDMPLQDPKLVDPALEHRMDLLRKVSALGRSLRSKHKLKTRQVLPSILVITRNAADQQVIEQGAEVIREELNVKEIKFSTDETNYVHLRLKPNLKALGPRLGKELGAFRGKLEALNNDPAQTAALVASLEAKGTAEFGGQALKLDDFLIERVAKGELLIATESGVTVLLDTKLTEELISEGLARELVNRIQRQRKELGFAVSDRIDAQIFASPELRKAAQTHRTYIMQETLSSQLQDLDFADVLPASAVKVELAEHQCALALTKR